ncbi:hypothetical protein [Chelativorans sp. YIM 93263]|uniref:hypothetical protein n=1 Tax=Chelativorans sp. YIM 93263 TaxID=2906648 RepID=UPI002378CBA1|nr:hypothetical protein [Chelativorans sp. YIM 93263]
MFEKWNFAGVLDFDKERLERRDLIEEAKHALIDAYKDLAPAEALFRATMSERLDAPREARFWVDVYISMRQAPAEEFEE